MARNSAKVTATIGKRHARSKTWSAVGVVALATLPTLNGIRAFAQESGKPAMAAPAETKAQRDARMAWWREARFGMFIHWGLYAVPAGVWQGKASGGAGEWLQHDLKIPVAPYAAQATQFDPEKFDADAWVAIAKAAGMRYIVMTAKHHEGFAMYHTAVDGYNLIDATPFKRDPIMEMAAACKKAGIKFGVYYSQSQDWHHAGGGAFGGHWDTAQDGSYDDYLKNVAVPQVRELIQRVHPAVIWWDTPVDMTPERAGLFLPELAKEPELIYNNRLGGDVQGDTETPEQRIPATGYPGRDWETCMTINDTWGYKTNDHDFKSTESLLHNLIDIASKGGNYLLNVGPDATGIIPAPEVSRLSAIGDWMSHNGGAIYGTSASPYKRLPFDGRCTQHGDHLYLEVFHWPDDGLALSGLQNDIRDARVLATGESLKAQKSADGVLRITRPKALDAFATVVDLHLSGPASVMEAPVTLAPQTDGAYRLTATDATLIGETLQVEQNADNRDNVGYWTNAHDRVAWNLTVPATAAGNYRVELEYACEAGAEGSTIAASVDGDSGPGATGTVASTGSWQTYKRASLDGTITLAAGTHKLTLTPRSMPGFAVMNLRGVRLTPVR